LNVQPGNWQGVRLSACQLLKCPYYNFTSSYSPG